MLGGFRQLRFPGKMGVSHAWPISGIGATVGVDVGLEGDGGRVLQAMTYSY